MKTIGLVGGIASGKSAVAHQLGHLGAVVLNADKAAHRVINRPDVKVRLRERWGAEALTPEGKVNRAVVARHVFGGPNSKQEREFLEGLLHPRIREEFAAKIAELAQNPKSVVVIDAPLLLEAGWEDMCDQILFVDAPDDQRLLRAQQTRNWNPEEFSARQAVQMPIEEKRHRASDVLVNSGSLEELRAQVARFWSTVHS